MIKTVFNPNWETVGAWLKDQKCLIILFDLSLYYIPVLQSL